MQHARRDRPGTGVLQTDHREYDPGEEAQQDVGHQHREHIVLDRRIDLIQHVRCDVSSREGWSGHTHQLPFERVSR